MNRAVRGIPLQYQNGRPSDCVKIVLDHNGGRDAAQEIVEQNTICRQLAKAMQGRTNLAARHQRLDLGKDVSHFSWPRLCSYSAASLALLFRGFTPAAFFSTGARNLPV
jgi:hypothetical protein